MIQCWKRHLKNNSNPTNCHETLADSMKDQNAAFNKVIQSRNTHETKEQKASHKVKTDRSPANTEHRPIPPQSKVQLAKYIYTVGYVCAIM